MLGKTKITLLSSMFSVAVNGCKDCEYLFWWFWTLVLKVVQAGKKRPRKQEKENESLYLMTVTQTRPCFFQNTSFLIYISDHC